MNERELKKKVRIFVTNGKDAEAQDVLKKLGFGPEELDAYRERLGVLNRHGRMAKGLLAEQKAATAREDEIEREGDRLDQSFRKTANLIFKEDEPTLTSMGLYPPLWRGSGQSQSNGTAAEPTNGTEESEAEPAPANGRPRSRRGPSKSGEAKRERWRLMLEGALELEEAHQARLAKRGWPKEQIEAALQVVEAFEQADTEQTHKTKAYRKELAAARAVRQELEAWYSEARGLTLQALKYLPEDKAKRLKRLLEL